MWQEKCECIASLPILLNIPFFPPPRGEFSFPSLPMPQGSAFIRARPRPVGVAGHTLKNCKAGMTRISYSQA